MPQLSKYFLLITDSNLTKNILKLLPIRDSETEKKLHFIFYDTFYKTSFLIICLASFHLQNTCLFMINIGFFVLSSYLSDCVLTRKSNASHQFFFFLFSLSSSILEKNTTFPLHTFCCRLISLQQTFKALAYLAKGCFT